MVRGKSSNIMPPREAAEWVPAFERRDDGQPDDGNKKAPVETGA